jgi:hypothetical protein
MFIPIRLYILLFALLLSINTFSNNLFLHHSAGYGTAVSLDTVPSTGSYNFYVANNGTNNNDGRSPSTPKQHIWDVAGLISSTPAGVPGLALNLLENNLFREEYYALNNNIIIGSYGEGNPKRYAKITGMDIVKDWSTVPGYGNTYQHLLTHSIDLSGSDYHYIITAEIDSASEVKNPVSSVKYLSLSSSIEQCNNIPGSYYVPAVLTNPVMVYIHPTAGIPGSNKFRYEVATRNYNINGNAIDNGIYRNLFLQTSGNGYGMFSGGKNTLLKNSIIQGGGTHHMVIKSGQIDSCIFLPGPKGLKDRITTIFYSAEGKDDNNKLTNTIFLDAPSAIYTHTDGTVNHKSLLIDNVYAFGDSTDATNGLSANDTDSVEVNNCYVENYPTGWWYGGGTTLNIKNSMFRKTNQSAIMPISKANVIGAVKISNVLIETDGNDNNQNLANGWTAFGVRAPYSNVNVDVSNSILHCFSTWHTTNIAVTAFQVAGFLNVHRNIYICDVNDENSLHVYSGYNYGGLGSSNNVSSDYNAYILLRGSRFHWQVLPNNSNDQDRYILSQWQTLTGQDKNSIVIDLRNNPLGLKAIFVDPDNGNWTLAKTLQADSIRKISAGMTTPPLFYPRRPLITGDSLAYKKPGGFSSFMGAINSETEIALTWQTFNESDLLSFNIESSMDGSHFTGAGTLDATSNGQNNSYQYLDTHDITDSIFYRLKLVFKDGTSSYSSVVRLSYDLGLKDFKINIYPNPFHEAITVVHPRRDNGAIRIYDYMGKLLKVIAVQSRSSNTVISLINLPSGQYFVQWTSAHEKRSGTIIK